MEASFFGLRIRCDCPGRTLTGIARIIQGVGLNCIAGCLAESRDIAAACSNKNNAREFRNKIVKSALKSCCNKLECDGTFNNICRRSYGDGGLPRIPKAGCKSTVIGSPTGDAYYCVCKDGVTATGFTSFAGVDKECTRKCGTKALRKGVCQVGANGERTFAVMGDIFRKCCVERGHKVRDMGLCGISV